MTEAERKRIHELIADASGGDSAAALAIEEAVLALEREKASDDSVYILDRLRLLGIDELHERILDRMRLNGLSRTDDRPPWVS